MLGIPDPGIWSVFILCILSAILCVVYGIVKWNADAEPEPMDKQDEDWVKKEKEIEEEF